jgi:hypothetical protein
MRLRFCLELGGDEEAVTGMFWFLRLSSFCTADRCWETSHIKLGRASTDSTLVSSSRQCVTDGRRIKTVDSFVMSSWCPGCTATHERDENL